MPCMTIDFANYQHLWCPWQKALIIKVLGRNISHKLLMQRISELWKLDWECEFIDLEGGYYLVRFRSQKDYDHVLNDGLSVENFLLNMGNLVGRVVKVDPTTLFTAQEKFVRVCVEIDLEKPQVLFISILGHVQAVEYEGLHLICFC
ncbi:hypothetical protein M9H77_07461 [Catharanthus roseus]|uniref:Uncharacterized protein n=1 Tax=Catharanthus roseus TaxID=4058 RepID=A0ACC0BV97_CATRO|nr:hypothetical protein M9H77_07461 [Catharanthus roseus]